MSVPPPPLIAIVGATGYVGNFLTNSFLLAKKDGLVSGIVILTTAPSDKTCAFESQGCEVKIVNYAKKETLLSALKSVNIVVSAMGTRPGWLENGVALLEAMVEARVRVYFPSQFGTNHYSPKMKFDHAVYADKKLHMKQSLQTSLKVVGVHCSNIMEYSFGMFGKMMGIDCEKGVWRIVGNGNTPVAMTASRDIGRFTVAAALLSWRDPVKVPKHLEIAGVAHSLKECAKMLDAVSGKKTRFEFVPYSEAVAKFEASANFFEIFPLIYESGGHDVVIEEANGNRLFNPGQRMWTFKTFKEYAQEVGGVPLD